MQPPLARSTPLGGLDAGNHCRPGLACLDDQSLAFADPNAPGSLRTYEYTYDPNTYRFQSYQPVGMGMVRGQEVSPDGTVYLAQRWLRGNYIAITVYR